MKEKFKKSAEDLRAEYEAAVREREGILRDNGTAEAIEALSEALRTLRNADVDVSLKLTRVLSEEAFDLIKKVGNNPLNPRVTISGVLSIAGTDHFLALCVKEDVSVGTGGTIKTEERDVLKLYVSNINYGSKKLTGDFRGECFDLKEDAEALYKFQKFVISWAAYNEAICRYDVGNSLENNPTPRITASLKKPAPAPKTLGSKR